MNSSRINKIGIVIIIASLVGTVLLAPSLSSTHTPQTLPIQTKGQRTTHGISPQSLHTSRDQSAPGDDVTLEGALQYDTTYVPGDPEETAFLDDQDDAGYSTDTGDKITRALPIFPSEIVDGTPGRGTTGTLDPNEGDDEDWYQFSAAEGQILQVSVSSIQSYGWELTDTKGEVVSNGYTVTETGTHFLRIFSQGDTDTGTYTFSLTLAGQNDAGSRGDAGNTIATAMPITPGTHSGYLDRADPMDWYSFNVNAGQGIFITLKVPKRSANFPTSDFDVYLYNPQGVMVHQANYYGDDTLEYPADVSGTWKIQLDIFPGWDTTRWPENYYLYGSGAYTLELTLGGTAQAPPPVTQPEIIPVAQTFSIPNDPTSTKDEYTYLAAIPAANYLKEGVRYVSPIIYTGDTTPTHWSGTVDDTTQYLLDDWETYLARHNLEPTTYTLGQDPVAAAALVATTKWTTSDTAVLVIDGSGMQDETRTALEKEATLRVQAEVTTIQPGDLVELVPGEYFAAPMFMGSQWGAMTVYARGTEAPTLGIITPRYEAGVEENWPYPSDGNGDNTNIYFPIALPGMYFPYGDTVEGDFTLEVTKYAGDRYKIPLSSTDTSLTVTVTTDQPSYLEVFLVDPQGSIRRPSVPHWNGGPINPIHIWNGWHSSDLLFEEWRRWEPTYSTEHTVTIDYPTAGKWTAIVTPHYPYGEEMSSDTIPYSITAEVREHSQDRVSSALSAANGAVIASQTHVPLLYVTEDSVPTETTTALTKLGVKNIIFVNINNNGQNVKSALGTYTLTDLNTYQKVIDHIKAGTHTENYITITSLAPTEGYFAPAAMIAAYHGSPILDIGEIPDIYNLLDKAQTFREYGGSWYHGCRAQGYLAQMSEPFDPLQFIKDALEGNLPDPGFDQEIRWWGGINQGITQFIQGYNLEGNDKEAYLFVSPRDTGIRNTAIMVMSGNNSYAGQIPFDNIAMDTALICRDILYPALIYANPSRDVTTTQLMNYPDGTAYSRWDLNDGTSAMVFTSRDSKNSFSSHGRLYDPHVIWENVLERRYQGASVNYYAGHGTGGSGISAQYKNVAEQFPSAEHYVNNAHTTWWDSWRGYSGYDAEAYTADASHPRWGGTSWFNPTNPGLYDIIHFKYVDELFGNLHSNFELWQSCTTGQHFGPDIFLEHGSAVWYGNAGTGSCPPADWLDDQMLHDLLVNGEKLGEAYSKYVWFMYRDFTTLDPTALYAWSSLTVSTMQVIYGDPTLVLYSPDWVEPAPLTP